MKSLCHRIQMLAAAIVVTSVGAAGCGGIGINPAISECGGFDNVVRELVVNNPDCGDDVVRLTVDSDAGLIHFLNEGVMFNCCGDRDISVDLEDGVYVVSENDSPTLGGGRCGCSCLFDYAVDIPCKETNQISLRIERFASDEDDAPRVAYDGVIDISQGSAEVVLRTDVGWCF